jgi:hypothetical protein
MKNLSFYAIITACTLVFIACEKNEQQTEQLETSPVVTAVKDYVPPRVENNYGKYFEAIDTIYNSL